ncbi:MAG: tetratricopeptide repeat protein [Planctomycetota bacterium]|nr:MAG: tetratricopeptide repeat protein [Planctomycetota bacterium]
MNETNDSERVRRHLQAGALNEAIACCRRFLAASPNDAETQVELGLLLRRSGQLAVAGECFRAAIAARPELAVAHRHLAELLASQGASRAAEQHYRHALQLDPFDAVAHVGLSGLLCGSDRLQAALAHARHALRLQPELAIAHVAEANVLQARSEVDEAVSALQRAITIDEHSAAAHCQLGFLYIDKQNVDEAIRCLETAARLSPRDVLPYHYLGELHKRGKYHFAPEMTAHLAALSTDGGLAGPDASLLDFTLAAVEEQQGHYDAAFTAYQRGNERLYEQLETGGQAFNAERLRRRVDATISVFDQDFFAQRGEFGSDSETPIFVIGMPRSGTTLVEQIIASHPEANAAGELGTMQACVAEMRRATGASHPFPDGMTAANSQLMRQLGQRYLAELTRVGGTATRIVDKMWANFLILGFIAILFPKTRIVHCRRDALDVGLSCYLSNFSTIAWACRLEDIGRFYREYERLMRHWTDVLPMEIHDVQYEDLVAQPAEVSRELIAACGLAWDDRCLEFYKLDRPVQTASRLQVREPIYRSSVDRWKRYAKHLDPLRKALGH